MDDTYLTISRISEGIYKEKMSKFLAFAIPVSSVEDVKKQLEKYQKEYYDARHVCWAYMLGPQRPIFARTITENLRERPENLSSDKSIRRD